MTEIDFDLILYIWTAKLGLPERDFFEATFGKVCYYLEKWTQEQKTIANIMNGKTPAPAAEVYQPATSFKSVLGGLH